MSNEKVYIEAKRSHYYDDETGQVFRILRFGRPCEPMAVKTLNKDGYVLMTAWANERQYVIPVHRFVWFLYHGFPDRKLEVDHINGVKSDNRISNLRIATRTQNRHNSKSKGYWPHKTGGYQAEITTNGVRKYLGFFKNEDDAKAAYFQAAKEQRKEFLSYVVKKF